ncbi:EAL domain-containing protein [Niveibacterium umoris]|uniref:Diguanylate cyclase (GGDEF)-like protein n=1 Tax=Niveibacterium umoris TaxID=1193620 RepID=A0A840BLT2_9RHOO|nr:EAL domain-containing protein [Niveibacterium umoris]MBB4012518.1 diguanylate cyclase (GGDEF)-like protein [Niveibacterium umoris]
MRGWLRAREWSFGTRIGLLLAGLLGLFFVAAIVAIRVESDSFVDKRVRAEVETGARVLHDKITQDRERYRLAARVLAADFGFREAVATRDAETIVSALANHARRINANAALLFDPDGQLVASTPANQAVAAGALGKLMQAAQAQDGADGIATFGGRPMVVVVIPVRAPNLIGWIALGFDLNDSYAAQLGQLIRGQVAVVAKDPAHPSLTASNLPPDARAALVRALGAGEVPLLPGATQITLADTTYLYVATPLIDGGDAMLLDLRSLKEALESYDDLRNGMLVLLGIAFLVAVAATRSLARTVSRPIRRLASAAGEISAGNYALTLPVEHHDEIGRLSTAFNDMARAVELREAEIVRLAYSDPLTDLHNRAKLGVLGEAVLKRDALAMVVVLDIDRFSAINNALGDVIGDVVIRECGVRLRSAFPGAEVARLAADEFAMLFGADVCVPPEVVWSRLEAAFARALELDGAPLDIALSAGIASYPAHGGTMSQLLRNAEIAMNDARRHQAGFAIYTPELDLSRTSHLSLLSELRQAVEQNELRMFLQPKVCLKTGRVDSAEALIRWQHPRRGFVPPFEFIPFAEQTGRIGQLTRWMLLRAMELTRDLAAKGTPLTVSVNVSARDVQDAGFPEVLDALLAQSGGAPERIRLEITESGVMENADRALTVLHALRARGFTLSLDDFGTGYSSLAYLRRMPVSELKIDRSFVQGIHRDADGESLVKSTIELSHNLGLSVVAEGVETIEEWQTLVRLGSDYVQGYFASKPLAVEDFIAWRAARTPFLVEAAGSGA